MSPFATRLRADGWNNGLMTKLPGARTADEAARNAYQCCFCGLSIEAIPPNPCSLELRINFPSEPEMSQELYGHAACLKNGVVPTLPTLIDAI